MPQFNTIAHKIFKCLCIWQLCLTGQNVKKKRYFEHDVKIVSKHYIKKREKKRKQNMFRSTVVGYYTVALNKNILIIISK